MRAGRHCQYSPGRRAKLLFTPAILDSIQGRNNKSVHSGQHVIVGKQPSSGNFPNLNETCTDICMSPTGAAPGARRRTRAQSLQPYRLISNKPSPANTSTSPPSSDPFPPTSTDQGRVLDESPRLNGTPQPRIPEPPNKLFPLK